MIIYKEIVLALFFYLIPTLIGRASFWVINKNKEVSYPFVSYFIFGALNIFSWVLIEKYLVLALLPTLSFTEVFRNTIYILGGLALFINLILIRKYTDFEIRKYIQPLLLSIFLACIVFFIWNYNTPYPLNWDFLEHQTLVNNILSGRFSFITSQISDTFIFNGYSSIFHTLIASVQILLPIDILGFWSSISFFHLVSVILASYLLAYIVTDDEVVAILSAILSAFIFETITFTNLFFIPQTVTAVFFVFLLNQLLLDTKRQRLPSLQLMVFNSLFLFLNHYIIGLLSVVIYTGVYLYIRFGDWLFSKIKKTILIETGIFTGIILILFSSLIHLGFINQGEAEFFNFNLTEKFSFMQRAYGYSFLLFLPLGISYILKRKKEIEITILIVALSILILVLIQAPYVFKFYVVGRFFINLIVVLGIYSLLRQVSSFILKNLLIMFFIFVFIGIFIANSMYWKNMLNYNDILTHISPNELKAAKFLKKQFNGDNTLIISDPATQNIFETFSGINSQGGAYANQNTRNQLIAVSEALTTYEIKDKLNQINDTIQPISIKKLFILSGRYFQWQSVSNKNRQALYFNIWIPSDLTINNIKYIQFLSSDPRNFTLIYMNPSVAIFEINKWFD